MKNKDRIFILFNLPFSIETDSEAAKHDVRENVPFVVETVRVKGKM